MTPEEFLQDLAAQIGPAFRQTRENLLTINANFVILFDRMERDHEQIKANFDAIHRDMLVTQTNIETTHRDVQALLEITRSHERRLEDQTPTGPIHKGTGTEGR